MRKHSRFLCLLLSILFLCALAPQVSAQETGITIRIISREGFLNFAENCRLDSYSQNLTVLLCSDIDLTDADFAGIPIFCGTFEGNGHTISGFALEDAATHTGLFRRLTETATIRDLHVSGYVKPGGSAAAVGGIVGINAGAIENCDFEGTVAGSDSIGGLVGINLISGRIDDCQSRGNIHGNHFVGGIAGDNYGVIRNCENLGQINTTVAQNQVELENINIDTIINSEAAPTVTDIGGICGTGTGVIQNCVNNGHVGYPQIGYNVGGIAGSFSGYIYNCINRATIDGRKEVGGIVGQLEPAVNMVYEEDTLQTLQQQMDDLSATTNGIGASIQNGSHAMDVQSVQIEQQLKDAQDALKILIPEEDNDSTVVPDEETLQAARNALSSSLSGITDSIGTMSQIGQSTLDNVAGNLQSISGQMNAISGTISTASENIGGGIQDVSDQDTAQDLTAKIRSCYNLGTIQGDWNIGGITGAIGPENDLDPESDLQIIGNSSLNFDMQLRAVILDCENRGIVSGKKQNAGGIVGCVSMGLVKGSLNCATVEAASADYVGGIAGQSSGFLRNCNIKCSVLGDTHVGGIAGSATTVSDCKAIVILEKATEAYGAILGSAEEPTLTSNYYLLIGSDPGAVDGVSYNTQAQPLPDTQFFALADLPASFRLVTVRFMNGDTEVHHITLPYGSVLAQELMPALPEITGCDTAWVGDTAVGESLHHDVAFHLETIDDILTLESDLRSEHGLPTMLLQGAFQQDALFTATAMEVPGSAAAWSIVLPESKTEMKLRCHIPAGYAAEQLHLQLRVDGIWQDAAFTVDNSYLVCAVPNQTDALQLIELPADYSMYYWLGGAGAAVIALIVILICSRKKKSK